MSSMKEHMMEMQEEQRDRSLAKYLGISYDEFCQLDYNTDTEESNDGLIYNYILTFGDNCSNEILSKISDLDDNYQVWISASDFENL